MRSIQEAKAAFPGLKWRDQPTSKGKIAIAVFTGNQETGDITVLLAMEKGARAPAHFHNPRAGWPFRETITCLAGAMYGIDPDDPDFVLHAEATIDLKDDKPHRPYVKNFALVIYRQPAGHTLVPECLPEPTHEELLSLRPISCIRAYLTRVAPALRAAELTFSYVELARLLELPVSKVYVALQELKEVDWKTLLRAPDGCDRSGPLPEYVYGKGRRISPQMIEAFRRSEGGMSVNQIRGWYDRRNESTPKRIESIQPILQTIFFGAPAP